MPELLAIDDFLRELKAWGEFNQRLRDDNRYVVKDRAFIDRVLGAARRCEYEFQPQEIFYRARRLPYDKAQRREAFPINEMGAPPAKLATPGRLNPEGISCLYVADHEQTAIAEIRPYRGAVVCVARLQNPRPLRIIDLLRLRGNGPDDATIRCLSRILAQPVHQDDALAYVGTQYLAETLKSEGFGGIRYESALREGGRNVAFFDASAAIVGDVRIFTVRKVSHEAAEQTSAEAALRAMFIPAGADWSGN